MRHLIRPGGLASVAATIIFLFALLALGVSDELRTGAVSGSLTMRENGKPLAGALVIMTATFQAQEWERPYYAVRTDRAGNFKFSRVPSGQYSLDVYSRSHSAEGTPVYVAERATASVKVRAEPATPYLDVLASQHVYTPAERPQMNLRGFAPETAIQVEVYKVQYQSILSAGGLQQVLSPYAYENSLLPLDNTDAVRQVRSYPVRVTGRDPEGIFQQDLELDPLEEGIYWVSMKVGKQRKGIWLGVSRIAMVVKAARGKAVAYVTDLVTGQPIEQARISIAEGTKERQLANTGSDGLAEVSIPTDKQDLLIASVGGSTAFCTFYASRGDAQQYQVQTYTDRTVYRPGDEVSFKSIVRSTSPAGYGLPPAGRLEATVTNEENDVLQKFDLPLNARGSAVGSFKLPPDSTGPVWIQTTYGEVKGSELVRVAAYRKAQFKITVTPLKPYYLRGETVAMRVHAEYYFGGPLANARVTGSVMAAPVWQWGTADETYDTGEEGAWVGDYIADLKEVRTNAQGDAIVTFDSLKEAKRLSNLEDLQLTFSVSVAEADQYFEGSGMVKLSRGEYSLFAESEVYGTSPGGRAEVKFKLARQDGKAMPNEQLRVEAGYVSYVATRSAQGYDESFERRALWVLKTNEQGEVSVNVRPPRSGSYVVRAWINDSLGNRIEAEAPLWVYAQGERLQGSETTPLDVKIDKKSYAAGDTARVLISSSTSSASALVTVSTDEILTRKVVPLTNGTVELQVPLDERHSPNAFVDVALVSKKRFLQAGKRLLVESAVRKLQVSVSADRAELRPGEIVTYRVRTLNTKGQPVSAEFSLGVVDEAIYAIVEDQRDPLKDWYPMRWNSVETAFSFPELYLDGGDKSPSTPRIRENFKDTAFWAPQLQTGADGEAVVTVRVPENLTSWRATVIAMDDSTAVGKAKTSVVVRKDLMVRVAAPAYFVEGDRVSIAATVNSGVRESLDSQLRMSADGATPEGEVERRVPLSALGSGVERFDVRANRPGMANLAATVRAGERADGMRLKVPVLEHGRLTVDAQAGEVSKGQTIQFKRLPGATVGNVRIVLTRSLPSTMLSAVGDLIDYPYSCTEQTVSRFVPAVGIAKVLRGLGMRSRELEAKIPNLVSASFTRLRTLQRDDGGFSWFESGPAEAYLTAMVIEGLWRAKQAGVDLDTDMLRRALSWSKEKLRTLGTGYDKAGDVIYLAYAISLYEQGPEVLRALRAYAPLNLQPIEQSLLALAWDHVMHAPYGARAEALERRQAAMEALRAKAITGSGRASWSQGYGLEATARAFQAFSLLAPKDPLTQDALRFLMLERKGDGWVNTRDSALVLEALTDYITGRGVSVGVARGTISLNGSRMGSFDLRPQRGADTATYEVPTSSLPEGPNELRIDMSEGTTFYSVEVRQTPHEATMPAQNHPSGLALARTFHTVERRLTEDGSYQVVPSREPVSSFQTGAEVLGKITLTSQRDLDYVVVEVPLPANLKAAEDSLDFTDVWWSSMQVFDDKVVLFARVVPGGKHEITFMLRAEMPGDCAALPAIAYGMYTPDIKAYSSGARVEVRQR